MSDKETYLQEEQYYSDLYDLQTIKECLRYYHALKSKMPEMMAQPKVQHLSEEKRKNDWLRIMNIVVYSIKTSRFEHKRATIEEWMNKDRIKQERFDAAQESELYCPKCNVMLNVIDKTLRDWPENTLRILFLYECPRCNLRKDQYDTGEEYKREPDLCEKCGAEIKVTIKFDKKKDTTTWIHKCTRCDYKKVEVENNKKWQTEHDLAEKKDQKLLAELREEFCFSEKEGNEAVLHAKQLSDLVSRWKKDDKKSKDPIYQKVRKLNKLKVIEVKKLLTEALEKEGYTDLQFEKPEMGRFVAVPFVVQDSNTDREGYNSKQSLKKLINSSLEVCNWRLMSEGINYRVGYLSGRLRCYENEDELANLYVQK
jgi:hypothetical protein